MGTGVRVLWGQGVRVVGVRAREVMKISAVSAIFRANQRCWDSGVWGCSSRGYVTGRRIIIIHGVGW